MWKHTLLMSVFAVALVASPSEAQQRESCAWNDYECIRRGGEPQAREPQTRQDQQSCKWNDLECIRRETERERQGDVRGDRRDDRRDDGRYDRDGRYERDRRARADVRCTKRDKRGECKRWERVGNGRDDYRRHSRMPNMASALAMRNGRGIPGDARPWVGNGPVRVELINRDRDRVPEQATIRILGTNETQVWVDRNNDGRADLMRFYRNGRLVRELK